MTAGNTYFGSGDFGLNTGVSEMMGDTVVRMNPDAATNQEWSAADLRQPLLDVELLRAFVAVVDCGGYTTAAQTLYKTQSAVSLQIKRLEEQIGLQLFDFPRRKVVLTNLGKRFLPHARRVIRSNIDAISAVTEGRSLKGRVRVGTNQLNSVLGLPEIFSSFYGRFPGVQIELNLGTWAELRDGLGSKYDITLNVQRADEHSGTVIAPLRTIWVGSASKAVHTKDPLPVALLPSGSLLRDMAIVSLSKTGMEWRLVYESSDVPAVMAAANAGLAVTVSFPQRLQQYGGRLRELGEDDGFSPLPACVVALQRAESCTLPIAVKLEEHIAKHFETFEYDRCLPGAEASRMSFINT